MLLFSIHLSLNDTTNQKTKSCTHTWLSVLIATANIKQQPHARAPAHIVDSVPTSNMLIIHTEKKENKWKCPNIWIRNESRTKKKIKSFIYIYITFLPRQIAFISLTIIASISRILKTEMRETNYKSTHFFFVLFAAWFGTLYVIARCLLNEKERCLSMSAELAVSNCLNIYLMKKNHT